MATNGEIKIGERLDMQRGSMVYVGDGKADAYVTDQDGKDVLKQSGVVLTRQMIDSWVAIKAKQAAYVSTRTSATL